MPREIPDLLDFRREPSFVRKSGSRPQRNEVLAHDGDGLRIGRHLQIATTDRKIGLGSTEQVKGFDRAVRRQFGALKESVPVHIINAYFSMATLQGSLRSTLTASYHLERSSFRLKTARRDGPVLHKPLGSLGHSRRPWRMGSPRMVIVQIDREVIA